MNRKHYIIPIFVPHKGCPHNCIFCNQKKITGNEKEIFYDDVVATIDEYLQTIDKNESDVEVSFFGGSFTGIPIQKQNELLSAARNALDQGRIDTIRLSTRPDYIDKRILDNLTVYGVGIIELGVQSLDDQVLLISERGHSSDDVYNAVKLIREYDFKLGLQMMVGLPGDNKQKDIATAQKIIDMRPDFVRIYPALTIKETYMEELYNEGKYVPVSIEEAVDICKQLYIMFEKENIKIIRMGLQATDNINTGKDITAGPFHPAFGEMVESAVLNDMLDYMIQNYFIDVKDIIIEIAPSYISKLYSCRKKYFINITHKYATKTLQVRQSLELPEKVLTISGAETCKTMSIYEFIKLVN